jgi:hypothetical protein
MAITFPSLGVPGISVGSQVTFSTIWQNGAGKYKPGGGLIDVTRTRDVGNSDGIGILRTGLLMAYYPTAKAYANFRIGTTSAALTGSGTSITIGAAEATELVRRVGSTGSLVLTGPEAASGTVRQMTATYSAVNTTTGVVTITALGANQVENVRMNIASTGGSLVLNVAKTDGTRATTGSISWSATDATYLAAINSALDTASSAAPRPPARQSASSARPPPTRRATAPPSPTANATAWTPWHRSWASTSTRSWWGATTP